jgi:putative transposase
MRPLQSPGFPRDVLTDGRRFRVLAAVDDFDPEYPALPVDSSLSGRRVARELDRIAGPPSPPVMTAARLLEFSRERSLD